MRTLANVDDTATLFSKLRATFQLHDTAREEDANSTSTSDSDVTPTASAARDGNDEQRSDEPSRARTTTEYTNSIHAWVLDCAGAMEICEWDAFVHKVQGGRRMFDASAFTNGVNALLRRALKSASQRAEGDERWNLMDSIEFLYRHGGDWNYFIAEEGKSIAWVVIEQHSSEERYHAFYDALESGRVSLDAKARADGLTLRQCIDEGREFYPFAGRLVWLFDRYRADGTRQCLGEAHARIIRGDCKFVEHWCERAIFFANGDIEALNYEFVPYDCERSTTLLHAACANVGAIDVVRLLTQKYRVNPHGTRLAGEYANERSAAAIACAYGFRGALRLLLECGLDPDRPVFRDVSLRRYVQKYAPTMETTLLDFERGTPAAFTKTTAPNPPRLAVSTITGAVARILARGGRDESLSKYVYVLRLEAGFYYVGASGNIRCRIQNHVDDSRNGTTWTKQHKPIGGMRCIDGLLEMSPACIAAIYPMTIPADEAWITLAYMQKYGLDRVRGGPWCAPILAEHVKATIKAIIDGCSDVCFKCGESGHFKNECQQPSSCPTSPNTKRRLA